MFYYMCGLFQCIQGENDNNLSPKEYEIITKYDNLLLNIG